MDLQVIDLYIILSISFLETTIITYVVLEFLKDFILKLVPSSYLQRLMRSDKVPVLQLDRQLPHLKIKELTRMRCLGSTITRPRFSGGFESA